MKIFLTKKTKAKIMLKNKEEIKNIKMGSILSKTKPNIFKPSFSNLTDRYATIDSYKNLPF